ncbi:uncharacterized protein LOC127974284 [Carassius gibelio]|uniref:uncharacterized protein LOC127974284 n=1 Tax=Carassius gibelio TaxID=101364 RepID=UPI002278F0AC|nr:uncharacterized protein LOC127974284 [Carassius gibelio]
MSQSSSSSDENGNTTKDARSHSAGPTTIPPTPDVAPEPQASSRGRTPARTALRSPRRRGQSSPPPARLPPSSPASSYRSAVPTIPPIGKWTVAGLREALGNSDIQASRKMNKAELYDLYVSLQSTPKTTHRQSKARRAQNSPAQLPPSCSRTGSGSLRPSSRRNRSSASLGRAPDSAMAGTHPPPDEAQPSTTVSAATWPTAPVGDTSARPSLLPAQTQGYQQFYPPGYNPAHFQWPAAPLIFSLFCFSFCPASIRSHSGRSENFSGRALTFSLSSSEHWSQSGRSVRKSPGQGLIFSLFCFSFCPASIRSHSGRSENFSGRALTFSLSSSEHWSQSGRSVRKSPGQGLIFSLFCFSFCPASIRSHSGRSENFSGRALTFSLSSSEHWSQSGRSVRKSPGQGLIFSLFCFSFCPASIRSHSGRSENFSGRALTFSLSSSEHWSQSGRSVRKSPGQGLIFSLFCFSFCPASIRSHSGRSENFSGRALTFSLSSSEHWSQSGRSVRKSPGQALIFLFSVSLSVQRAFGLTADKARTFPVEHLRFLFRPASIGLTADAV